jgi:trypsin-like peptidase
MTAWSPERPPWQAQLRRTRHAFPAGAGLLCTDSHVVTCAHVIAPKGTAPAGSMFVVFQFAGQHEPIPATVIDDGWHPEAPDGSGDIAVLALDHMPPLEAEPAPLCNAKRVWEHRFRAYGYPKGHERDGVWSHGMMVGHAGPEWLQLEANSSHGHRLQKGFSGAPIWDNHLKAVVGIVVASDKVAGARTGYGISIDAIGRCWPTLAPWVRREFHYDRARCPRMRNRWSAMVDPGRDPAPRFGRIDGTGTSARD